MNWIDIVIVLFIGVPAFFGFRTGFIRRIFGIAGLVLGFVLAVRFYDMLAGLLSKVIHISATGMNVLCFLIIVLLLYGLSIWLARFMSDMTKGTHIIDRTFGLVLGALQGILLASILLFNLSLVNYPEQSTRNSSLFYSRIYPIAPKVFQKVLGFSPDLEELYDKYKNVLPEKK